MYVHVLVLKKWGGEYVIISTSSHILHSDPRGQLDVLFLTFWDLDKWCLMYIHNHAHLSVHNHTRTFSTIPKHTPTPSQYKDELSFPSDMFLRCTSCVLYTVSVPHTSTWWFYSQCRSVFDNFVPMTWRLLGQEMMVWLRAWESVWLWVLLVLVEKVLVVGLYVSREMFI